MKTLAIILVAGCALTGCSSVRVSVYDLEDRVVPSAATILTFRKGEAQPFTGIAFDENTTGRLKEETTYRAGRETGMYRTWYPNGQKQEEVYKIDGVANGRWYEWHDNGQWEIRGTAKNGCSIGRFRTWDANGIPTEDRVYPEEGILQPSAIEEGKQNQLLHRTQ